MSAGRSNRTVQRAAAAWGWVKVRDRSGHWEEWEHGGTTVRLRPASYHQGNPPATVAQLARATGVTVEQFLGRIGEPDPTTPPPSEVIAPPVPAPPAEPEPKPTPAEQERMVNQVRDLLISEDRPMHTTTIAKALGLTPPQVSGAAAPLVRRGQLQRLGRGVYAITERLRSERVRHDHQGTTHVELESPVPVVGTLTAEHVAALVPMSTELAAELEEMAGAMEQAGPTDLSEAEEDDLDAMLDLLAPNGYQGRHRRLVNEWAELTRRLMREVRR